MSFSPSSASSSRLCIFHLSGLKSSAWLALWSPVPLPSSGSEHCSCLRLTLVSWVPLGIGLKRSCRVGRSPESFWDTSSPLDHFSPALWSYLGKQLSFMMTLNDENRKLKCSEQFYIDACWKAYCVCLGEKKKNLSARLTLKGNGRMSYWNNQESDEEFTDLQRQGPELRNLFPRALSHWAKGEIRHC